MQTSRRGFTFIELITVILVASVLGAAMLSWLSGRGASQEREFRDRLKLMLEHARQHAIAAQRDVCVRISATQVRAFYTAGGVCSPASPVAERAGAASDVLQVPAGVFAGRPATLRFDARGLPVPNVDQQLSVGTVGLRVSSDTGIVQ